MQKNQTEKHDLRAIRWDEKDWDSLAKVARSVGLSRSDFVRSAALHAAKAVQAGVTPYFVGEANASLQNMGASFFSSEGDQKIGSGRDNSASTGRGAIDHGVGKGRSAPEKKRSV